MQIRSFLVLVLGATLLAGLRAGAFGSRGRSGARST